jgi:hypothetical protein
MEQRVADMRLQLRIVQDGAQDASTFEASLRLWPAHLVQPNSTGAEQQRRCPGGIPSFLGQVVRQLRLAVLQVGMGSFQESQQAHRVTGTLRGQDLLEHGFARERVSSERLHL